MERALPFQNIKLTNMPVTTKIKQHHIEWLKINWVNLLELKPSSRRTIIKVARESKRWYVYILWRLDLGEPVPFYVGKGTKRRITQHTAPSDRTNRYKSALLAKLKRENVPEQYSLVSSFEIEEDAYALEVELIDLIGRAQFKSGPLVNRTDGGDGGRGHIARSGEKSASARAVYADGIRYGCLNDAATPHHVTPGAIAQRIRNGWLGYYYEDEGQRNEKEGILGRYKREVSVPNGTFESLSGAASATGESVKSIYKRIRAGWGNYYYVDEGQRQRATNDKPCEIEGERFPSQVAAAKHHGVTKGVVAKRIRSSNFKNWKDLTGTISEIKKEREAKVRVWIDRKEYESAAEASRDINVKAATILCRLSSSNFPNYIGEGIEKTKRNAELAKNNVPVFIENKQYSSLSEASRSLDLDISTIKTRCKSIAFPNYISSDPSLSKTTPKDGRPSLIGIEIDGVKYRSINAAHKSRNEPRATIKSRLEDPNFKSYMKI